MTLEVRDLVVRYGSLEALHGVSLRVSDGEFVAVLGRNGAGKTTLVHAIAGAVGVHGGSIAYRGQRIDTRPPGAIVRSGIAVVPEGRQLFGGLSVADNLRLGAYGTVADGPAGLVRALRPRPAGVDGRMRRVLELLPELRALQRQRAATLSGGQQQMVAVGRALMAEPSLLLVDELSLGLAPLVVKRLLEHLEALRDAGITVLLIEQNIELALSASERAYVIEGGLIRYSGTSEELANSPKVLSTYLGVEEAMAG